MDMLACLDMRKLLSTLTTTFSSRNITEQFLSYVPPPLSSILSYKAARQVGVSCCGGGGAGAAPTFRDSKRGKRGEQHLKCRHSSHFEPMPQLQGRRYGKNIGGVKPMWWA